MASGTTYNGSISRDVGGGSGFPIMGDVSVRNRFDRSYLAPGFFGQTWGSWFLFVILVVSAFFLALSLNRALRRNV